MLRAWSATTRLRRVFWVLELMERTGLIGAEHDDAVSAGSKPAADGLENLLHPPMNGGYRGGISTIA